MTSKKKKQGKEMFELKNYERKKWRGGGMEYGRWE